jgi:hypothetical protein
LIYVVIGLRQMIAILNSLWHGSAVDFDLFEGRLRHGPDFEGFNPKDDFQLFLASGLLAFVFARILGCRLWLRQVPRRE